MSARRSLLALIAVASLGPLACRQNVCGDASESANVTGDWTLSAEGDRPRCEDDPGDSEIQIRSQVALSVAQADVGGGQSLFLRREVTAGEVSPGEEDGGVFSFSGSVEGSCVDFTTRELTSDGELRLSFQGRIRGTKIEGSFTDTSVASCQGTGSFRVDITPDSTTGGGGRGRVLFNPDASVRRVFDPDAGCADGGEDGGEDGGDAGRDAGEDAGENDAGEGDAGSEDAGELDAGESDAGSDGDSDAGMIDAGLDAGAGAELDGGVCLPVFREVVENVFPCSRSSECRQGLCEDGVCIAGCERGTDCFVGESCIDFRCQPAPGCGCTTGFPAELSWTALILAAWLARRSRNRGRSGESAP